MWPISIDAQPFVVRCAYTHHKHFSFPLYTRQQLILATAARPESQPAAGRVKHPKDLRPLFAIMQATGASATTGLRQRTPGHVRLRLELVVGFLLLLLNVLSISAGSKSFGCAPRVVLKERYPLRRIRAGTIATVSFRAYVKNRRGLDSVGRVTFTSTSPNVTLLDARTYPPLRDLQAPYIHPSGLVAIWQDLPLPKRRRYIFSIKVYVDSTVAGYASFEARMRFNLATQNHKCTDEVVLHVQVG